MLAFGYYLLKVIICSAVLFGYYWFFLHNKIYHAYNRYYLLAVVIISLIFPVLSIHIFHETAAKTSVVKMLQVVNAGDEYMDEIIISNSIKPSFGAEKISMLIYIIVSFILLLLMAQMLISIFKLVKKNQCVKLENINFINTNAAKGTPFSFFRFIFWNKQIDVQSAAGNRIFKHELAHIQERHSWDKMFINLVLIAFWTNPIFWLIRKELSMIHEFIADKKAVEDGDTAAFAAMILQTTYPQQTLFLTNSFFYSPIKRRLMMLTKIKNNRTSYISRLLVLPLLIFVFAAFTIKAKEIGVDKTIKKSVVQMMNKLTGIKSNNSDIDNDAKLNAVYAGKQIIVVIDAGHGGSDAGAKNKNGMFEKDINLLLVKKIAALNKNENIKVILSRTEDVYDDPKKKAAFAREQHADLFISVHLDATPGRKASTRSGMDIYVAKDEFENSKESKVLASSILGSFKSNYDLNVPSRITQRKTGIYVIQANNFPSVLVEPGCLTNDKDLAYLLSEKGQEIFAKNILAGINNYANNILKNETVSFKQILNDTLYYFNGKQIKKSEIEFEMQAYHKLDVKFYKREEAAIKFKTSNNEIVVEIFGSRQKNSGEENNTTSGLLDEVVSSVTIKQNKKETEKVLTDGNPLYVINGKISNKEEFKVIVPAQIESVNVLKGNSAIAIYGAKGKDGVIEIITKKIIPNQDPNRVIFTKTEIEAQFPGGKEEWKNYLQKNLHASVAVDEGWKSGTYTLLTKFIVEKDGSLSDFTAENYPDSKTAKHCIEVLKNGPKWRPAMQNGHIVASIRKQPFTFVIEEESDNNKKSPTATTSLNDKRSEMIDPVFRVGNLTNPRVKMEDFLKQKMLNVTDGYTFNYASVYFSGTGFKEVGVANLSNNNLELLKQFLDKCVAGSAITFDNVKVSDKNGMRTIDGISYSLY